MKNHMLNRLRALDLTDGKGFVCGKILANLGVEVIKLEKPGGDPSRNLAQFYRNTNGGENDLHWLAFNTDKKSITLDLETEKGKKLFKYLVKISDFIIESFMPGYLDDLEIGYEALSKINPRIIMVSITHFGQTGPYSRFKSCELVTSAMSGVLENTGYSDRPPVKEALDSVCFHANIAAALGALISHHYREVTEEGQQVDVSIQEVAACRCSTRLLETWMFDKVLIKRTGAHSMVGILPNRWIWPCKDGYLFYYLMGGPVGAASNQALSKWIDNEGIENPLKSITNWNEFDRATITKELNDSFEYVVGQLFLNHTKEEIQREALNRGINIAVINNIADVLRSSHLADRDYWIAMHHSDSDIVLNYPKYFFVSNKTENFTRNRAPFVGENNDEIYRDLLKITERDIQELKTENVI